MPRSFRERIPYFQRSSETPDLYHAVYTWVAKEYVMYPASQEDAIATFAPHNEAAYDALYKDMESLEKKLDLANNHPFSAALMEIVKFAVDQNKKLYPTLEASKAAARSFSSLASEGLTVEASLAAGRSLSLQNEALAEIHAHSDALLRPIADEVTAIQERCYNSIGNPLENSHDELVNRYVSYMNEQIANKAKQYLYKEQWDQSQGQQPSSPRR